MESTKDFGEHVKFNKGWIKYVLGSQEQSRVHSGMGAGSTEPPLQRLV